MNIGDKIGKLEIIDNNRIRINNGYYYKVKCECGKEYNVQCSSIKNGKTVQCKDCYNKSRRLQVNIGDVYKDWKVLEALKLINNQLKCKVQCTCGNIRFITTSQLLSNKYKKCKKCNDGKLLNKFRPGFLKKIERGANIRNIEYSPLLTSQFLYKLLEKQNFKCALTGENLLDESLTLDKPQKELNLSLDRINSNIGYVPNNVQWVTKQVNWSKSMLNNQEFINLCNKVINHANQQPSTPLTKCEGSETNS